MTEHAFRSYLQDWSSSWDRYEDRKEKINKDLEHIVNEYLLFEKNGLKTDPHFDRELCSGDAKKFNQRFWEIILGNKLIASGLSVSSPTEGPDFIVKIGDQIIYIEAVCATRGTGENKVPNFSEIYDPPRAYSFPTTPILQRWTNAIKSKNEKYKTQTEGHAYVIAINGGDLSSFPSDLCRSTTGFPYAFDAVYGTGDLAIKISLDEAKKSTPHIQYSPNTFNVANSAIPTDIFFDVKNNHISAILVFSQTPIQFLAHKMGNSDPSDMFMIHNHLAKSPILQSHFPFAKHMGVKNVTDLGFEVDNFRN